MKTGTLLQSFLLAAGLVLGGIPAVQADHAYPGNPGGGKYHHLLKDKHSHGHAPWWSSSYHGKHDPKHHVNQCNSRDHDHRPWHYDRHDAHGDRHDHGGYWKHGKYDGRGDWYGHGDHWKHDKYDARGDRHDHKGHKGDKHHKDYKKHGKRDGRDDQGRKGYRSSSAGIGYTGRS